MSTNPIDGRAIVYCEGSFGTTNGKTAHGLVRRTDRYDVVCVVDSRHDGADAGQLLGGRPNGIPLVADLDAAVALAKTSGEPATHFVIGLTPDGGRLEGQARKAVSRAIEARLHVDSGLHDFLCEQPEIAELAHENRVRLRDVRKPPERRDLHFYDGRIREVESFRIAMLGTDSAVGKRTTAWMLVDAFRNAGRSAEMVGTGQTAWMQGARYSLILDSLINDFVTGEIEHAVWRCWKEAAPDVIVLEGQGSLLNPAYPGGFELLAAGKPHVSLVQHAPARTCYDGFPDAPMHPLDTQIQAIELISGKPVAGIAVNHEGMDEAETRRACREIADQTGLPAVDALLDGVGPLVESLLPRIRS